MAKRRANPYRRANIVAFVCGCGIVGGFITVLMQIWLFGEPEFSAGAATVGLAWFLLSFLGLRLTERWLDRITDTQLRKASFYHDYSRG